MIDCEPLSGNRWQLEPICSAETLLISPDNSSESDWDRTSNSNLSQSSTLSSYNNIWEAFSVIQCGEEHEKEGGGSSEPTNWSWIIRIVGMGNNGGCGGLH